MPDGVMVARRTLNYKIEINTTPYFLIPYSRHTINTYSDYILLNSSTWVFGQDLDRIVSTSSP